MTNLEKVIFLLSQGVDATIDQPWMVAKLLGQEEIKLFEIGTIFKYGAEAINIAFSDKKEVKEMSLEEYCKNVSGDLNNIFESNSDTKPVFKAWSLFPFIARDVAVWVPENISSEEVVEVINKNKGELAMRGPELFDQFKKEGKVSYAFRIIFQSYERTLNDAEINLVMEKISVELSKKGWQVR